MPADMDNVAISLGRYHARARALVFEHRIGGDRRAVIKMANTCGVRCYPAAQFQDALHDAARGIVDGGRHLVNGRFIVSVSNKTTSVKVPPTSTPINFIG